MRLAANFAFAKLEDFSQEPEDGNERHQRELESRVAEALEQGYQRGYGAGRSDAETAAEAQINEMKLTFTDEMAARQSEWQQGSGSALVETLQSQIDSISEMLEAHIAALMKPVVKDKLYQTALLQFHEALDGIFEKGVAVEIRGSEDLVRGAIERLGETTKVISFVTSDEASVEIKCDETTVSANFAQWFAKVEEGIA